MDVDYDDIPTDPNAPDWADDSLAAQADASPTEPDAKQANGDLSKKVTPKMQAESKQVYAVSDDDDTDWHWCPQCSRPFEPDEYAGHFEAATFRCREDKETAPVRAGG